MWQWEEDTPWTVFACPACAFRFPKTSTCFAGINLNSPQVTSYPEARSRKPVILYISTPRSSSTAESLSWDSPVFVKGAAQLPSPVWLPPPLLICTPFLSKGLFVCPGPLRFLLCSSPCSLGSYPRRGPESSRPLSRSKPCPRSPPLTPSAQCLISPSVPFLFWSLPHPSTCGFSSYQPQTDEAEILINPFSVDNTTIFPILRLTFLHQRHLVSGVMIPTEVSLFIPLNHYIFPALSPSVPHTHRSPHPINLHIKETVSTSGAEKNSFEWSAQTRLLSPTEKTHPSKQSVCALASPRSWYATASGSMPFPSAKTMLWRQQLITW